MSWALPAKCAVRSEIPKGRVSTGGAQILPRWKWLANLELLRASGFDKQLTSPARPLSPFVVESRVSVEWGL